MRKTIYLDQKDVPAHLRGTYRGKQFQAEVCETVTVPIDAGLWDSGSREKYHGVRLADGAMVELAHHSTAPWDPKRRENVVTLQPGIAVVRHSVFCGTDMGLTFYVHSADAAPLLPAPVSLSISEKAVLNIIGRVSARHRLDAYLRFGITPAELATAVDALIEKRLVQRNGAITTAGRNACDTPW